MRNWIQKTVAMATLAAVLGSPLAARAVTYDDSFDECSYPIGFDLVVMRPLSLATILTGTVLFIPMGAVAGLTVPKEIDRVYDMMIGSPWRFTFHRQLGECNSIDGTF